MRRGHSLTVPISSLFDEGSLAATPSSSLPDSASRAYTASDIDQSQMVKTVRNTRFRGFSHTLPVGNGGTSTGYPLSARRPSSLRASSVNKLAHVPRVETFCAFPHQERTNSFNSSPFMRRSIESISNESQCNGRDRMMRLKGIASPPSSVQSSMQTRVLQAPTVHPPDLSATGQPLKTGLLRSDMQIHRAMAPWPVNSPLRMGLAGIMEETSPELHHRRLIS